MVRLQGASARVVTTSADDADRNVCIHAGGQRSDKLQRNVTPGAVRPCQGSAERSVRLRLRGLAEDAQERDIEQALTRHITRFLLELGAGFAFVGRQYRIDVGGDEFFIDLLFYHLKFVAMLSSSSRPRRSVQSTRASSTSICLRLTRR
ncbi:hypothetical protein BURKHO8Y_580087 [Burkholderia sp. 8Y]|nr:hypothetical protein BURKHO8Y_580087 [Burkholderia sp. 8Y]